MRYIGDLGLGHEYIDAPNVMVSMVGDILKRIYFNEVLEKRADFDRKFDLEMERYRNSK